MSVESVDRALLDTVCSRLRSQLPDDVSSQAETFVRQYYRWVPPEDLAERNALDAYGVALAHFNLARRRTPGTTTVRVYNPEFETHGWQSSHTAVEVVTDDMPFLTDSVTMELSRRGFGVHLLIHPVLQVRRDAEGRLQEVLSAQPDGAEGAIAESVIHAEIDRQTGPRQLEELRAGLADVLDQVRAAVEDWPEMRERALAIVAELEESPPPLDPDEVEESRAFLAWLEDHAFTFLGYREYRVVEEEEVRLEAAEDTGLGILRQQEGEKSSRDFAQLPPGVRSLALEPYLLNLTKANSRATVHRPSYLDYVGVKTFDADGRVTGERRLLGLYTHTAYHASPREIPVLRRKVDAVLDHADFPPGSHNEKALVEILETFPRDELFQISVEDLVEISLGILHLGERQRVRLFVRRDPFGRFLTCLVFVPRDRFNTDNRRRIEAILREATNASTIDYTTRVSESVLVRLHYLVYTEPGRLPDVDAGEIEARIIEATRAWTDDLEAALVEEQGEERSGELIRRYRHAFPTAYRADWVARSALSDIRRIEALTGKDELAMSVFRPLEAPAGTLRAKLYKLGSPLTLSNMLPLFEDMGVEVADERPYEIAPDGAPRTWIYDFGLHYHGEGEPDADGVREAFQDAFLRAWRGDTESDGYNRLVLGAGLTWREITVLRAVGKYLRQSGIRFSDRYVERSVVGHPEIARLLIALFKARFDPRREDRADAEDVAERIEKAIDAVESLDQDQILRTFLGVIRAMLRTDYFRGDDDVAQVHVSFKLDPGQLDWLPLPRPEFEVFVYSPRTEGTHLRGGRVARGGLRWSDRREDFRTEVLGLMKAQQVKNAVIVPVGAKGGFVVKRPPAGGRQELMEEVVACYRTFIRGLLGLTDNIVDGEITGPPEVARYDGEDPYLVVAADKGTATFSDIANQISLEQGFWLGDAFASGGETGYDHKAMGITARGAWECVKRHFRELGRDVQEEGFTAVGIGDMSGDVFGNGMLLSRHLRLIGAFNHEHVFLDPDPDPEASWEERRRLFELERSSWADYDSDLVSEGGGVFRRSAKSIPLSGPVREVLDIDAEALPPNELIRALLRAPVDLLWNGGIGTYVKAGSESHAAAGDKANDAVRVSAGELRCRVVGEGGNLGLTQLARIEYALAGGRINTDAIDNAGGVDCSDREVNIKVLLDAVVADGDLTPKQRNALLAEMTEAVAALVLQDSYEQSESLTLAEAQAASMVDVHQRFIRALEGSRKLDRELEFLPNDEELAERKRDHLGLTRPELAALLAYSKVHLYAELLDSDVPEDPYLSAELQRYFPDPLPERFAEQMEQHRLRREIVATQVVNNMYHGGGITFAFRLAEETGAHASEIARGYAIAREVFDMRSQWGEIEALDNLVDAEVQIRVLLEGRRLIERSSRWLLRNRERPLAITPTVEHFAPGAAILSESLIDLLVPEDAEPLIGHAEELMEAGVPDPLATRIAGLGTMIATFDIVEVAADTDMEVATVAAVYFRLGNRLQLHWLRDRIVELPRDDRWRALARAALRDDLFALHRALTAEALRSGDPSDPERLVNAWVEANPNSERTLQTLRDIQVGRTFDLTTLPVGVREVRNLI